MCVSIFLGKIRNITGDSPLPPYFKSSMFLEKEADYTQVAHKWVYLERFLEDYVNCDTVCIPVLDWKGKCDILRRVQSKSWLERKGGMSLELADYGWD